MDFRRLRHALALKEERSYVKAAAKLHIGQPGLSQSIAQLEEEIGLRLFDRDRNGVQLTSAGKIFMARAEKILRSTRSLEHEMKLIRGVNAGSISFGMGSLQGACVLKDLLRYLVSNHPTLQVRPEIDNADDLLDHLISERLEFFVASKKNVVDHPLVDVRPLIEVSLSLFGRRKHPLASKRPLDVTDLQSYPLLSPVVFATTSGFRSRLLGADEDSDSAVVYCDDFHLLKEVAMETDALLIAPRHAVATEYANRKLLELPVTNLPHKSVNFAVVTLKNRTLSPLAELLIHKIMELTVLAGTAT